MFCIYGSYFCLFVKKLICNLPNVVKTISFMRYFSVYLLLLSSIKTSCCIVKLFVLCLIIPRSFAVRIPHSLSSAKVGIIVIRLIIIIIVIVIVIIIAIWGYRTVTSIDFIIGYLGN